MLEAYAVIAVIIFLGINVLGVYQGKEITEIMAASIIWGLLWPLLLLVVGHFLLLYTIVTLLGKQV